MRLQRPKSVVLVGLGLVSGAGYGLVCARRTGRNAADTLKMVGEGAVAGSTAGFAVGFTGRAAVSAYLERKNSERLEKMELPPEAVQEVGQAVQGAAGAKAARLEAEKAALKHVRPEILQQQSPAERVLLKVARPQVRKLWG